MECSARVRDSIVFVALAMTLGMALAFVLLTVARNVNVVVPVVSHEVDRLAARVVLLAMLPPVLRMTRGHAQVDRLRHHRYRHALITTGCG